MSNPITTSLGSFEEYFDKVKDLPGIDKVKAYLDKSDYMRAPASTKFHANYPGGLKDHSCNVVYYLLKLTEKMGLVWSRPESPYVIGLFHDLCKTNFYKETTRNVKGDDGLWRKEPFYQVSDSYPLGHGSKSVILLLQLGLKLTTQEIYCITYHMGAFGDKEYQGNYSQAVSKCPLILYVSMADQLSGLHETGDLLKEFQ